MTQCIHCTVWQTATSRSLNDHHMNCHGIIIVCNYAAYIIKFSCLLFIAPGLGSQPAGPGFRLCRTAQPYKSWRMKVMVKFRIDTIHLHCAYVKAARPVPDGEMFTLSIQRSFMHRWPSFPFPIQYACQFISFFQYIIIRVRQAKLWH